MKLIVWVIVLSFGAIACKDSGDIELPGKDPIPDDGTNSGTVSGSVEVKDNLVMKSISEAGFYNYEKMDLRTNNPEILKKIPGLNEIFPKIGLYKDKFRKEVVSREESGGLTDRLGSGFDNEDKDVLAK